MLSQLHLPAKVGRIGHTPTKRRLPHLEKLKRLSDGKWRYARIFDPTRSQPSLRRRLLTGASSLGTESDRDPFVVHRFQDIFPTTASHTLENKVHVLICKWVKIKGGTLLEHII